MTDKNYLAQYMLALRALNRIDDYFEYSFESVNDREVVHRILKDFSDTLEKLKAAQETTKDDELQ